jgi:hypothetical protein
VSIDLKTPNWTLVVHFKGKTIETTTHDAGEKLPDGLVPEGARFAVSGRPSTGSFIYVVETAPKGRFVVVDKAVGAESGGEVRRPKDGWFTAPFNGTVRVVEAPRVIDDGEWKDLLEGRDPPPKGNSPKNMGAADVPQQPTKPKKTKETKRSNR